MHYRKTVAAVIVAAGQGTRFGGSVNKVYQPLAGKPVIEYSIEVFDRHPEIDEIVLVVREGEESLTEGLSTITPVRKIFGGASRKESVHNGLLATYADIVLIHDGARPFVKESYITDCLTAMDEFHGATMAIRARDTVKIADSNNIVERTTDRAHTWLIQTPQCFRRETILLGHDTVANDIGVTDDCQLLESMGYDVKLIPGDETNLKITSRNDIILALDYLNYRM